MPTDGTHISGITGNYYVAATAPTSPEAGDRWFNTTNGTLNYYDTTNSVWKSEAYTSTSTTTTSTSSSTTTTSSSTSSSTSTSTTTTSTSTTL